MGSGKVIKRAIEKHGLENFRKDILEFFENTEDMYAREKEIVSEHFLLREDVYNLRRGGHGGFDYINKMENQEYRKENGKKLAFYFWNNEECRKNHSLRTSVMTKQRHKDGKVKYDTFTGKSHSKETIEKIQLSQKQRFDCGETTWNAGKKMAWVYKEDIKKIILKDEVQTYLNEGWALGQKPKKVKTAKEKLDPHRNWGEIECQNCQIIFKACERDIRKNRKFCSLTCCGEFKTKLHILK